MRNAENDFNRILNTFLDLGEKRISRTGKVMILDDLYEREISKIIEYMANSNDYVKRGGDKIKGILLKGKVGSGKTTIFKIIEDFNTEGKMFTTKFVAARDVVGKYNSSKNKESIIQFYSEEIYCFDDIGKEPIASNYGKEDIFIRIFENRYKNFCDYALKTHITTNLSLRELGIRYGCHIEDRFYEMFNFHELKNKSFRRH